MSNTGHRCAGGGAAGVVVDLFAVSSGCSVVVFVAPAGESFLGGVGYDQGFVCVADGEANNSIDAVLDG